MSLQGFARAPHPLAWFANATFSRDDGHRNNSDLTVSSLFAGAGTSFGDRRHHLLVTVDAAKARSGVAGSTVTSDPDDRSDNEFMFAGIGYQHRFNFDNRLIVRLVAGSERVRARAPQNLTDPLGRACTGLCNSTSNEDDRVAQVQLRHLITLGDVDITYGAEAFYDRFLRRTDINDTVSGIATERDRRHIKAKQGYAQAIYKPTPTLALEGRLFVRSLSNTIVNRTHVDPRIGVAWHGEPPTNIGYAAPSSRN